METTPLLAGISQKKIKTGRLEVAYLEAGTGETPIVLVHGNTSSSLFFQDFMLELAATRHYTIYAPGMHGFGNTQALPINATRGLRDFSDDLSMKAGTRLMEDRSWNIRKKLCPWIHFMVCLHDDCGKPFSKKNSVIN